MRKLLIKILNLGFSITFGYCLAVTKFSFQVILK